MSKHHKKYNFRILFSLLFIMGCIFFQAIPVNAKQPSRLIQTTTDEEIWNGYVDLGMTKTHIDEEDTLEEVQEKVKKSCVRIGVRVYNKNNQSVDMGREIITGSAFIININEKYLYLATNRHTCLYGDNSRVRFYPCFIDDELNEICQKYNIEGKLLGYTKDSDLGDFAIIQIDLSEVPHEYKMLFKSVPINKDTISTSYGTKGFFFHIEKNGAYTLREYLIIKPIQKYYGDWAIEKFYLQANTNKSMNGDSGSYCFDSKGNLLGIATGKCEEITYLLRPDTIFDAYEKIVGVPLE